MAPQGNTGSGREAELPEYAGHYLLESCLGSGGMGVVHLARSTSGMRLAVKVVHAEFARDPEFRGRFRQEVAAARQVSGAFTAPVVDADPDAGRPWMATLFIPGPTLSEQVKRNGPLEAGRLRRLMAGLAEALRDIHRVGVVHRDLKPSNVLLAEDGPKVIDFGISRPKDSELRTETGKLIGTPPFMAPEQFRSPREVGAAADVFALGSVMVHAATGRGPFDSDSPYVVAYQVVHDEPDLTGVPGSLAPLVARCLAKEPEDRPTPDELMRELRSVAASYDTQAFVPAQRTSGPQAPGPGGAAGAGSGGTAGAGSGPAAGAEAAPPWASGSGPRSGPGPGPEPDLGPGPGPGSAPGAGTGRGRDGAPGAGRPAPRRRGGRVAVAALVLGLVAAGTVVVLGRGDGEPARPAAAGSGATPAATVPAWRTPTVSGGQTAPHCSSGEAALLCAQPGVVFALAPSDGSVLWRHAVTEAQVSGPPLLTGGRVQPMTERSDRLEGLDPRSGTARWQRAAPPHSGMAAVDGMLLLTGPDGSVTGVDGASGETVWQHPVAGGAAPYFVSFPGDPLAYAVDAPGDGTSRITAVAPGTGEVRWETRLQGDLQPAGADGGALVLLAADPARGEVTAVVRYDPATGSVRRAELPVPRRDPAAAVHGNVVHLLSAGGSLEAVDMASGRRTWVLETAVSRGSTPVVDGRHLYFTAPDGRLLAVDARTGRLLGQTRPRPGSASDAVPAFLPVPAVGHGRVFASAPDGSVFSVPADDPARWD